METFCIFPHICNEMWEIQSHCTNKKRQWKEKKIKNYRLHGSSVNSLNDLSQYTDGQTKLSILSELGLFDISKCPLSFFATHLRNVKWSSQHLNIFLTCIGETLDSGVKSDEGQEWVSSAGISLRSICFRNANRSFQGANYSVSSSSMREKPPLYQDQSSWWWKLIISCQYSWSQSQKNQI